MSQRINVTVESTPAKAFATAIDWPGWSRSGKTADLAVEALAAAAPRYARVAGEAGEPFPDEKSVLDFEIVEQAPGGSGTAFGVPSRVTDADERPTGRAEAERLRRLVAAAWTVFDRVAATAPAELRMGPRGGGRDRDRIIAHVVESDHAYARELGFRLKAPAPDDRGSIAAMRTEMLNVLGSPSDGSAIADRRWTARYAAGRIAWHALDHAWEMEDRSDGTYENALSSSR